MSKLRSANEAAHVLRSSGLFLATNLLILSFGFGRVAQQVNRDNGWLLAANVVQVLFSAISIIAISGHMIGRTTRFPTSVVKAAVIVSIPLGWFVFFVHLIENGKNASAWGGNAGQAFGILGFIANCGASFGSQTLLGLQVTRTEEGFSSTHTKGWYRKRQIYYSFLYLLFAIAALGSGVYTLNQNNGVAGNLRAPATNEAITAAYPEGEGEGYPEGEGEGEATPEGEGEATPEGEGEVAPEAATTPEGEGEAEGEGEGEGAAAPEAEGEGEGEAVTGAGNSRGRVGFYGPFSVVVPGLSIFLGVLMLIMAIWHFARAASSSVSSVYMGAAVFVWIFQFIVVAMVSPGLVGSAYQGAVVGMLTVPLSFMPVYLDVMSHEADLVSEVHKPSQSVPTKESASSTDLEQQ